MPASGMVLLLLLHFSFLLEVDFYMPLLLPRQLHGMDRAPAQGHAYIYIVLSHYIYELCSDGIRSLSSLFAAYNVLLNHFNHAKI